jgi:hypothetical protein
VLAVFHATGKSLYIQAQVQTFAAPMNHGNADRRKDHETILGNPWQCLDMARHTAMEFRCSRRNQRHTIQIR